MTNCTFQQNDLVGLDMYGGSATKSNSQSGGSLGPEGAGVAIRNFMGFVRISNTTFLGNRAAAGWAIYTAGTMIITHSVFEHNVATWVPSASQGGAQVHFSGGGALCANGNVSISNCSFSSSAIFAAPRRAFFGVIGTAVNIQVKDLSYEITILAGLSIFSSNRTRRI